MGNTPDASHNIRPHPPIQVVPPKPRPTPHPSTPSTPRRLPTVRETSAGGLVLGTGENQGKVALIARQTRTGDLEWCLPKGHLESGETTEQAAIREVAEETGIQGEILQSLGTIEYWFSSRNKRIHKTVHHYLLQRVSGELSLLTDPCFEAVAVEWVSLEDLEARLAFDNERKIAKTALALLKP